MAKLERYGGNQKCVIATPEISVFQLTEETDFVMLGSDGVYDHLDNKQIKATIQNTVREYTEQMSSEIKVGSFEHISNCCGAGVNAVLTKAMQSESTDNLSVVLLVFDNFKKVVSQYETI